MGRQWKHPFSASSQSTQSTPDLAPDGHHDAQHQHQHQQADSLSSLLRSSSRKDPCNRLYRKAALLPDSSTHSSNALSRSDSAAEDMTYPPSASYRRDAEARASRSASNISPPKNGAMPPPSSQQPNGAGRYVDYNDISDDDDDAHLRSPALSNSHAVQDAVNLQRQTQQRLGSGAPTHQQGPEHWVPGPGHSIPNAAGPPPNPSGGVRGPPPGPSSAAPRGRPPSYSGGRPDELAVAGSSGGPPPSSSQPASSRPPQRSGPAAAPGAAKRNQNSRSPPERRSANTSSTHNGGPPPAMLNDRNGSAIQRLPTPSVAASVLQPLQQKVTEYSNLMSEAEDQVDQLDDQIRALQERRAAAESRYMEAKARHDEYRSQHADVERALRGDLPPLTPMLPPLREGQQAGSVTRGGMNPQLQPQHMQNQQRGGMQQRGSMGSLHDQYHYEHERSPQDNINNMNNRRQSAQYNRPMSSSSAGDSLRNGSGNFGPDGKKGKGRFRFSLFG
ncbi:hypothetical protein Micbo1qcDRAFT_164602 [Microdochium bolleyi]|uniref:Uncharacterized protein n=1 Tax=Microdochium bolleyi TaxID=196109 RepID=A0A136IYV6_9PEZI|nr:hypothetical protein Micbo1qcDRAFT_164602 [Microdochium bolleyi]